MTDGVTVHRDVVYSSPVGFRPLSLDLYVPPWPVRALCIYLHGGGWRVGSRSIGPGRAAQWTPSFFEQVALQGLAVASVDYRLSGEAHYPAQLDDVSAAALYLADNRSTYAVPSDRTVAWGVSAGGHLAAMYALSAAKDSSTLPPIDAVVCWYTPTDLGALPDDMDEVGGRGDRGPDSREAHLIGAALDDRPDLASAASPVHLVAAGSPAFLFLHGSIDVAIPPRQSQRLADALVAAGGQARLEIVDGASHMFPELDDEQTHHVVDRSVRFLVASLA